ncbi:MAG TPA: hypothetical protein VFI87_05325 [Hyphomicrobiaceae bacterium]|nr:hypothetical protein [Hyphomicrobiaceae bacterium]
MEENSNLSALIISSERVAETIAAAGINLAEWTKPIEANWLAVHTVPEVHYLSYIAMLYPGRVHLEMQRSERCFVATTGSVYREVRDEHTNLVRSTAKQYRFDERGALIRVNSGDYVGNTQDEKAKRVRAREADTPVTDEDALGVMAALLAEFRQFR